MDIQVTPATKETHEYGRSSQRKIAGYTVTFSLDSASFRHEVFVPLTGMANIEEAFQRALVAQDFAANGMPSELKAIKKRINRSVYTIGSKLSKRDRRLLLAIR